MDKILKRIANTKAKAELIQKMLDKEIQAGNIRVSSTKEINHDSSNKINTKAS